MELLILMMMSGGLFSGGGLMGLPPGERDAAFLQCAPADSLIYVEWAERSPGKAGAPGIDGLAADPEVRLFLKNLETAILKTIDQETAGGLPEEQILGKALPPLIKSLLLRPACLYAELDAEAAAKLFQEQGPTPAWGAVLAGLRVTLIVNAGDDADAMTKQIEQVLETVPPQLALEKTENLQHQKIPLPMPGGELTIHRHKDYLIVGFGKGTVDAAVAGLSGKSTKLSSNERFTAAMAHVQMERTAGVTWVDVKGLVTKLSQAMGPQGAMIAGMAKMTGADAIDSIVASTGVVDGSIRTKNYVATGGKTEGVLSLFAGRTLEASDFSHIPADADLVIAGSLSAPKILAAVRNIVGQADPRSKEVMDATLEQLEIELGVSIEEDIFAAFGDAWTIYDSPSSGGLFVSAPVLGLEVRDPKQANTVFTQVMKVFKEALPGEFGNQFRRRGIFLEQATFMDRTIYYVNTVGDDDVPVAPSFCLTDERLLVTLHPQPLKAHLRFLAAKEENFSSRLGNELKLPEGELLSLTYFDAKKLIRYFYAVTPYFAQIIFSEVQSEGVPIDIFSLPSGRAVLPYVGTSFSTTVRTKEGILVDSQSALPIPGASVAFLSMPLSFFMVGTLRGAAAIRVNQVDRPRRAAPAAAVVKQAKPAAAPTGTVRRVVGWSGRKDVQVRHKAGDSKPAKAAQKAKRLDLCP